jgi:NAD(P)-dependent dehydrogenase (short-subunit alcohol dehydrogenase family)
MAKAIVITGSSDGIGAAARQLHHDGHQVVIVGRSPRKTQAVAREIGAEALQGSGLGLRADAAKRGAGELEPDGGACAGAHRAPARLVIAASSSHISVLPKSAPKIGEPGWSTALSARPPARR